MSESGCATCSMRAKFDENPRSILGRLWRWHTRFCPGWKGYMRSLPEAERRSIAERYGFPPGKFD
ncbi:MAG: hypothetical protein V2I67_10725 [Thermoanaerobaculales bacterium]|nr:hypothetical protein [Thermoanaerobaculales bacterium]